VLAEAMPESAGASLNACFLATIADVSAEVSCAFEIQYQVLAILVFLQS